MNSDDLLLAVRRRFLEILCQRLGANVTDYAEASKCLSVLSRENQQLLLEFTVNDSFRIVAGVVEEGDDVESAAESLVDAVEADLKAYSQTEEWQSLLGSVPGFEIG